LQIPFVTSIGEGEKGGGWFLPAAFAETGMVSEQFIQTQFPGF